MTVTQRLPHPRSVLFGLVMTALLSAIGCGDNEPVTGKVTLNGDPVTAGTVVFTGVYTGAAYSAPIQSDGTYNSGRLPQGLYTVTLLNPKAPLPGLIPSRYGFVDSSGLSIDVDGTNPITYNINLTR